jgi:integrase
MHLLQGGVAPEVIALWLGHESPNTTHLYIEADMSMKIRALDTIAPPKGKHLLAPQHDSLLRFLDGL